MDKRIKQEDIRTRDYNMVAIINGVTKAGVHKDRKKEQNRKACRGGRKDWD